MGIRETNDINPMTTWKKKKKIAQKKGDQK